MWCLVPIVLALLATIVLMAKALRDKDDEIARESRKIAELYHMLPHNEHANMLDRVVRAKVYEGSNWEAMLVVAVSHKGAVAVRPVMYQDAPARWISKEHVADRVRQC